MPLFRIKLLSCLLILIVTCGCQRSEDTSTQQSEAQQAAGGVAGLSPEVAEAIQKARAPDRGFETPEAAWQAYSAANQNNDAVTVIRTLTDDSQKVMAAQTVMALGFAAAFNEEMKPSVTALMAKHGIDEMQKQPPPGITKDSTQLEIFRAIGELMDDPIAFSIEANNLMNSMDNFKRNSLAQNGELMDVALNGETATATLKQRGGRRPVAFRKAIGGWLVEFTNSQLSMKQSSVTTSGSGNIDRFGMGRNEHTVPPLEAISLDDVRNAWKVSVNYQQTTAETALKDITEKCGLMIYDQPDLKDTLQKKVDVSMDDVAAVQVIEEICQQVDLQPRYKAGSLALWEGRRTLPIAFAGPFLVEVTKLQEYIPNAYAKLELQFFAAGLPTPICSRLGGMYVRHDETQEGISLKTPDLQASHGAALGVKRSNRGFPARASATSVQFKTSIDVSNAVRSVKSIAPFDGSLTWTFPQKITMVELSELKEGESKEVGDATLAIEHVNTGTQTSVSFSLAGLTHKEMAATALDESGNVVSGRTYVSGYSSGDNSKATVSVQGKIDRLQIQIMQETVQAQFEYRLPEIPFTYSIDQPEQLKEPVIDGHLPVTFEFVRIKEENGIRSTVFSWSNHTNKDVHLVKGKIEFLAADGSVIKEQNINQSGNHVLLGFEVTEETNFFGHSPPEETASARISLSSVEFADTTSWSAPAK